MKDGNNDAEKWQWVDEDPIERLLGRSKSAVAADSPTPLPPAAPDWVATVDKSVELTAEARASGPVFDLAVSLQKGEKWDAAADSFRRALEIEPGRADAFIGLGASLLHLDNAAEAFHCFERCLSSNMDRERALFGKAVALQKLMRDEEADLAYRELLQIIPDSAELLGNLIALSVARQDTKSVGEYSRRLLQMDPRSKTALQGLATQALWNRDYEAGIGYCKRIVELDATSYEAWFNLGFARQHRRPAKKAMRSIA